MDFDLNHRLEIGLFFRNPEIAAQQEVTAIRDILARGDRGAMAVRLRKRLDEQRLVMNQSIPAPQSTRAVVFFGPDAWRMTWTAVRLDISVDAGMYRDIAGTDLTFRIFADRVAANVSALVSELRCDFHRLAAIARVEASQEACGDPTRFALRYLNDDIATQEGLLDVLARFNSTTTQDSDGVDIDINRIFTVQSTWQHTQVAGVTRTLKCEIDYNTTPMHRGSLTPDDVSAFIESSTGWVDSKILELRNDG